MLSLDRRFQKNPVACCPDPISQIDILHGRAPETLVEPANPLENVGPHCSESTPECVGLSGRPAMDERVRQVPALGDEARSVRLFVVRAKYCLEMILRKQAGELGKGVLMD